MPTKRKVLRYESPLAPLMERLVREKRASGYKYDTPAWVLKDLDHFLCGTSVKPNELPEALVLQWLARKPYEQASTVQRRIILVRQLARLMIRLGYSAYVPPEGLGPRRSYVFSPRILTHAEVHQIIQAVDRLPPSSKSPLRHIILPEVFRLLYGCGFRLSEVLNLKVRDVDLQQGVITVRQGKFGKDRLVPPAIEMVERLRRYAGSWKREPWQGRSLTPIFFHRLDKPPGAARRFISSSAKRYFTAAFLTADEAKDHESMICATLLPFIDCCSGMRKALT